MHFQRLIGKLLWENILWPHMRTRTHKSLWLAGLVTLLCVCSYHTTAQTTANAPQQEISLAGQWQFQTDPAAQGEAQQWFTKKLSDRIQLPGSMAGNNKGDDIDVNTPWTGSIIDSSWFTKAEYAPYRKAGNIKVPFWLQPNKYYKGYAWYQKEINIPASWAKEVITLYIERAHWQTKLWIDGKAAGQQNSLNTPHHYVLPQDITAGKHTITLRIDNAVREVDPGPNSHSISDHTQTNWNGMIGKIALVATAPVYTDKVEILPDITNKRAGIQLHITNNTGQQTTATVKLEVVEKANPQHRLPAITKQVTISDSNNLQITYPMGANPLLWDEFDPNLYTLIVTVTGKNMTPHKKEVSFGMRSFEAHGTQFAINNRKVFLRGTLECAIFPKTGYPPTDRAAWTRIFTIARSYGLNHLRFHSWCPPEAAFDAADRAGFYLQIECGSWANQGAVIGNGKGIDQYILEESIRIVDAYGNHPSFCMMAYGNEPDGNYGPYLAHFVQTWKARDKRRVYTSAAGWPTMEGNDYQSTSDPRIQAWGAGINSIINAKPPQSSYDWSDIIHKWKNPVVSHEIGQWCVYPDFKEIKKYTGVLKAKNFEIFRDKLNAHGMGQLADSFLLASGKLQALCYKADIEAALRTPGFGGFQLLDLHDFPGQGTALVGVLNAFWEDKGYITAREYSRFCNSTVPLVRFPKMIYLNNEVLKVPVEVAHFGKASISNTTPSYTITNAAGKILLAGRLSQTTIPIGNNIQLGTISESLQSITQPAQLTLTVTIGSYQNNWNFFVYPATLPASGKNVLITAQFDQQAIQTLEQGGHVLLTLPKGAVQKNKGGDIAVGFSSIFWNTAWTASQAPHTLGILVDPAHPALKAFPTQYHSNWQWWDAMSHSNVIMLDAVAKGLQPIVRVIDDWVTARPLGLVFECRVGKGKLIVSGIDLVTDQDKRPEARQLLYSLTTYLASPVCKPEVAVPVEQITSLLGK